jgi:hypothetical protein
MAGGSAPDNGIFRALFKADAAIITFLGIDANGILVPFENKPIFLFKIIEATVGEKIDFRMVEGLFDLFFYHAGAATDALVRCLAGKLNGMPS